MYYQYINRLRILNTIAAMRAAEKKTGREDAGLKESKEIENEREKKVKILSSQRGK